MAQAIYLILPPNSRHNCHITQGRGPRPLSVWEGMRPYFSRIAMQSARWE